MRIDKVGALCSYRPGMGSSRGLTEHEALASEAAVNQKRLRRPRLAVGWAVWGAATLAYAAVLWFSSYYANLFCYADAPYDDSPAIATAGLSLWPFGPGCVLGDTGWGWTIAAIALLLSGAALSAVTLRRGPSR